MQLVYSCVDNEGLTDAAHGLLGPLAGKCSKSSQVRDSHRCRIVSSACRASWAQRGVGLHTNHDVASTIELPINVHLGKCGPLRKFLHATSQLLIFQDVYRLKGYIQRLKYLHSVCNSRPTHEALSKRKAAAVKCTVWQITDAARIYRTRCMLRFFLKVESVYAGADYAAAYLYTCVGEPALHGQRNHQ